MAMIIGDDSYFSKIQEINSDKSTWNTKAKIIRLWEVSDFNHNTIPFSIEMVLMDADGGRIHATVRKTLIYKFKDDLKEGKVYGFENMGVATNGGAYRTTHHPYKLTFQFTSLIQKLSNQNIERSPYSFTPIADIVGGSYDTDFLVDVIGLLTGVGSEREVTNQNGSTTKLNVIELEADGHKIQCTLFGAYVDVLNGFIGAGDVQNAVVIMQLAKAKKFQDNIHIQNCLNCSVLLFNPTCEESVSLRARLPESQETPSPLTLTQLNVETQVQPIDEFLFNTPRSTLQALKEATTEQVNVVLGTVKRILNPDSYWYTACVCNKAVIPDSRMFFCEKCNKHVVRVYPRFCIKVRVMDHTDSATLVIFDKEASLLFNMTCADMIDAAQGAGGAGGLPLEIAELVEKTWLFKVEAKPSFNPRFEQSFRVRKICRDSAIINQFKAKWEKEEATFIKNVNENGSLSTLFLKGKDVLVGGTANVLSQDFETESSTSVKGKELIVDGTPVKVTQDLMEKFSSAAVNLADDSVVIMSQNMPLSVEKVAVHKGKSSVVDLEDEQVAVRKGKSHVVDLVDEQVSDQKGKSDVVKLDAGHVAVKKGKSDAVEIANEHVAVKKGKSDGVKVDDDNTAVKKGKSYAVKVDDGNAAVKKGKSKAVKVDDEGKTPLVKKKVAAKRVSPTPQEEDDDNAPIKLLKRAIKIEKLT
ncbi:hypothetical protein P8452_26627 [Trifolium repens]|nr:hypothetical protein P8452_26627 [Trifolium repens]